MNTLPSSSKGELLETSGTMAGGGKSVSRGRMGAQAAVADVDPRELQRTEVGRRVLRHQWIRYVVLGYNQAH